MRSKLDGETFLLTDGDVVIAAITSCTNTSNPDVMIGAGLVARRARELGLERKPWVKSSLAPGSKVVTEYLTSSGLLEDLEDLGFHIVGYGCTTCIGNSGPLSEPISRAVNERGLVAVSVLSGNRNFEGRISPDARANYLASPPLVVAYALAGTVDWDPINEPLGQDRDGRDVFLATFGPTRRKSPISSAAHVNQGQFVSRYSEVFTGSDEWRAITPPSRISIDGTRIPPTSRSLRSSSASDPIVDPIEPVTGARVLAKLGDSVTTDHISPAGTISPTTPAGQFLIARASSRRCSTRTGRGVATTGS